MASFIFLCDLSTESDCLKLKLFGTNPGEQHQHYYSKIAVGDTLFLYNIDTGIFRGPYKATTTCRMNINPAAWKKTRRKFPWQVQIDDSGAFPLPIGINDLRLVVPIASKSIGVLPTPELTEDQSAKLLEMMRIRNSA